MKMILGLLIFASVSWAIPDASRIRFHSKYDSFILTKVGDGFALGSQKIQDSRFDTLDKYFKMQGFGECPTLSNPELEIVVERLGAKPDEFKFFIRDSFLQKNDKCLLFPAFSLGILPWHRDFFLGVFIGVEVGKQLNIAVGDRLLDIVRTKSGVKISDGSEFPNVDFIPKWVESLEKFEPALPIHSLMKEEGESVTLKSGNSTHKLFRTRTGRWAMEKKGLLWTSDSWNFWGDLHESLFDPDSKKLLSLLSTSSKEDEKLSTLDRLNGKWNKNIENCYGAILKLESQSLKVRSIAAERLIQKPSQGNQRLVVNALLETSDPELRAFLSERLRIFNANGPVILKSELAPFEKLDLWKKWAATRLP